MPRSLPLIFFFVAACIGLLLRWHIVYPIPTLNYSFWLHGHSHVMFLGWVVNTFLVGYMINYEWVGKKYLRLFVVIQILIVCMLIFFPMQGYAPVTIAISTLHTFCFWLFSIWFFRDSRRHRGLASVQFARYAFILFFIASIAPFALGPLVAIGHGQSKWYYFIVYFYLHFQYNGVFIFGILSLFYRILEDQNIKYHSGNIKLSGVILFLSLFPTYLLSVLYSHPGILYNITGFIGGLLQLAALYYFLIVLKSIKVVISSKSSLLMKLALTSFILKSFLQILSAHPLIAQLAYDVRPFVIAYLHLVVIGVVTFFLLAWYIEKNLLQKHWMIIFFIFGFIGSEISLIISGIPTLHAVINFQSPQLQIGFSSLMVLSLCIIGLSIFQKKRTS